MALGNLAEWAIAVAIMMYNLGNAVNVEADSPQATKVVLWAWISCGAVFIILSLVALVLMVLS